MSENTPGFTGVRENKISGILPATNSGAPYLAFFARCGKFTAVSRQLLEISMDPRDYKSSRSVNFPYLPTKNVVRYGAPKFVSGREFLSGQHHPLQRSAIR
jgi:hypothetical protein